MKFSAGEGEAILDAIRSAERRTGAEIFAVLARQSDDYRLPACAFLMLWLLVVSLAAAFFLWWRWIDISLHYFAGAQMVAAVTLLLLVRLLPGMAVRFVPKSVRYRRAHAAAAQQFLAHGIHHTRGRTGVLVFVSLSERYAEIRADKAIAERFGQEFWNDSVGRLIDQVARGQIAAGYVEAIGRIGDRLAEAFPPAKRDLNELEDKFVIL